MDSSRRRMVCSKEHAISDAFPEIVLDIRSQDAYNRADSYARQTELESEQLMRKISLLSGIALLIAATYLIYQFGGVLWLIAWLCLVVFVLIEVLYYYGSKGSLSRSFRSHISSDAPDARIEMTSRTPRGWYDLDYRGRGRN